MTVFTRSASRSRRCCTLTPSARIGSVLSRGRHHALERLFIASTHMAGNEAS
jgi:hypothetical protein